MIAGSAERGARIIVLFYTMIFPGAGRRSGGDSTNCQTPHALRYRTIVCVIRSPLQLFRPQPAVDNRSEVYGAFKPRGLAAGCQHESGSRQPQSMGRQTKSSH